jgi:Cof subfamily protein (haloacid dehalogenase superfamily)
MLTSKYKLVVADVDGTLLSPEGTITQSVLDSILSLRKTNCGFTLATGRFMRSVRPIVNTLDISLPLILHAGSLIQDPITDKILYEDHLPNKTIKEIIGILLANKLQPVLYVHPSAGENPIAGPNELDSFPEMTDFLTNRVKATRLPISRLQDAKNIIGITVFSPVDNFLDVQEIIERETSAKALIYRPGSGHPLAWYQLEVFTKECSKGKALKYLTSVLGVSKDEVLSIGDNLNDLDLLLESGFGVAMGNASSEVRSVADATVGTNGEDGVAEAIKKFVLGAEQI